MRAQPRHKHAARFMFLSNISVNASIHPRVYINLFTSTTELMFCILFPHITFMIPLSRSLGFRQQLYGTLHLSGLGFDDEQLKYIFWDQSL